MEILGLSRLLNDSNVDTTITTRCASVWVGRKTKTGQYEFQLDVSEFCFSSFYSLVCIVQRCNYCYGALKENLNFVSV